MFENGLLPSARIEQIREDPANSSASARYRGRKHASNNLHGINATNLSSVVSTPPSLKNQLETRLDNVQATIASLIETPVPPGQKKCGRSKPERQATQDRRDNSAPKREKPARRDRKPALMNTVCVPSRTKRKIACLPNLRRNSGQSLDGAQGDASPIVLGQ